ncbi:hypothetical protein AURDEDRAFT_174047 [Auricularia subglabra TFB-10046 SS5]|nr:hypothetical protein AURDEDRAFT_174047 [Auricularia subglabra TFB-10046 SS5]
MAHVSRYPTYSLPAIALIVAFWLAFLCGQTFASSSRAPGGSGQPPARPPSPIPDDMRSETVTVAHPAGARLPASWAVADVPTLDIYPADVPRYFARRWTSSTSSWISPNSPTRGLPLPPSSLGARPCGCYDRQGRQTSVYGQLENGPLWPWSADWYDPTEPARPYAANIWAGMGPCPRLQLDSVLHRFPAYCLHDGQEPWYWVTDAARREMEDQEAMDDNMIPLLFPATRISSLPRIDLFVYEGAQNLSLLRSRWAAWVRSLLVRRTFVIFEIVARFAARALRRGAEPARHRLERLRQQQYFGPCPQGAWFDDVIGSAGIIRQFILEGVPVYYRWETEYETLPFLADLAPPEPPMPGSPRFFPPPTPRRPAPGGSTAPSLPRHGDSYRIPPSAAFGADGLRVVMDDVTLHQLEGLDPDRSPPAEPMNEERRASSDSRSDGSSTLSWGSSMDYDGYESPPRAVPRAPERGLALLQRMGDTLRGPESRAASPVSPTAEMLQRLENPHPASRSLTNRITPAERVSDNTAPRVPTIFDFLREGDGAAERGPFVPAPYRLIHPRIPEWGLIIQESDNSAAAREYFRQREDGALGAATEQLEYAFRHGMAYATALEFPRDQLEADRELAEAVPEGDVEIHEVPRDFRIARDTPLSQRYYQWARGVRLVLSRPHACAALARGGIIWRIARWAGLTLAHAMDGPTPDVREEGSRLVLVVQGDQGLFPAVDDWLSDDEADTLLGVLVDQSQSIWPDALVLGRNWWQGEWTDAHESWFQSTLVNMFANRQLAATRTRAQFRDYLRARDYHANGAGRQGRNQAGGQGLSSSSG